MCCPLQSPLALCAGTATRFTTRSVSSCSDLWWKRVSAPDLLLCLSASSRAASTLADCFDITLLGLTNRVNFIGVGLGEGIVGTCPSYQDDHQLT